MKKLDQPIQVTKSFLPPFKEYTKEIERIWNNHWLTNNGVIHQEFEQGLQEYLRVPNVSLLTNGHLALEIAIKALNLTGEIITTPFTFASTVHSITNTGLKPVFCDISLDDYNIDENKIEDLISKKTSAIIPVHVFGTPCNVEAIEKIAKKYNIKVIYDAAHAFGVEINNIPIGNFGDVSMFSMHATKVFHSIEGGVLAYTEKSLKRTIELIKNFGISGPESVEMIGTNAKMNEFQASMGLVNLRYIDEQIQKRKVITKLYHKQLKDIDGIRLLKEKENTKYNYSYMPILVDEKKYGKSRDELHEYLKTLNVFTRKYFYPLASNFACYKELNGNGLSQANYIADRVLTLPIYSDLEEEIIIYISEAIRNFKGN